MIYSCTENEKEVHFEVEKKVKDVFLTLNISPKPMANNVYRMGKKEPGKIRPIKVEFESASDVEFALIRARNLKDSNLSHVFVGPGRTKEDRLTHTKLVKEMIEKDPNKH